MHNKKTHTLSLVFALLASAIFGMSFMFSKLALEVAKPTVLLAFRFLIAFTAMSLVILVNALVGKTRGRPLFTPEKLRTLATGLLNSPLVTLSQLKSAVCLLLCLVHGTMIPEENILLCNDEDRLPIGRPFQEALFHVRECPEAHVTTRLEDRIAALVAAGNVKELARYMRKPEQGKSGKMSDDPLRQMKYHFVGFAVIVSRAAIKGGMD